MLHVKDYMHMIGKTGYIKINNLIVNVTVTDVKNSYGVIRYLVVPVSGSGSVWIEKVYMD